MSRCVRPRIIPFAPPPPSFHERRAATRYAPRDDHLWVGWWTTSQEFRVIDAVLRNISRTGAAVVMPERLFLHQIVWLRLDSADSIASVQGLIVGCEPTNPFSYVARMEFLAPCPKSFFETAVEGP